MMAIITLQFKPANCNNGLGTKPRSNLSNLHYLTMYQVKERPDVGVYVKDLHQFSVKSAEDMDKIMTVRSPLV